MFFAEGQLKDDYCCPDTYLADIVVLDDSLDSYGSIEHVVISPACDALVVYRHHWSIRT